MRSWGYPSAPSGTCWEGTCALRWHRAQLAGANRLSPALCPIAVRETESCRRVSTLGSFMGLQQSLINKHAGRTCQIFRPEFL